MVMMRSSNLVAVILLVLDSCWFSIGDDAAHLVTQLPGQPQVAFKQYAGQVTVNATTGKALFYWFYEANHKNHMSLPLAVWFNGGPGCSSVGAGALGELGPFRTNNASTGLVLNEFAWNQVANIMFIESPHGVGFSYSNTSSDYDLFTDDQTASDALAFLLEWFKKFPEYSKNKFYLLGESYAGHYVPTLAAKIVQYNKQKSSSKINLKGFAVGNPWTDAYYDNKGDTEFWYSHSLISDEVYEQLLDNCEFANDLPVDDGPNAFCQSALRMARQSLSPIDIYSIYTPSCNKPMIQTHSNHIKFAAEMLVAAYDPCLDSVTPYLNLDQVQQALHVEVKPEAWSLCSGVNEKYSEKDILKSMLPVYRMLLKEGLRIWIFSGDTDGVVATTATRSWIKQLNLTIQTPWYAWDFENQVGGWTQIYSGLTFASVRGAGHMVPFTKPGQALQVFKHFLDGKPLQSFQ